MRLIGLAGWSGSGKTTLMARLIPALIARGLGVSTIKHAHHDFDIDTPGKDSHTHRLAGAQEVLVAGGRRWALIHERRGGPEPALRDLLSRLAPVDLVLVEGFKQDALPKIEVHCPALGRPLLYPHDPRVVALVCDPPPIAAPIPVTHPHDVEGLADFVERFAQPLSDLALK